MSDIDEQEPSKKKSFGKIFRKKSGQKSGNSDLVDSDDEVYHESRNKNDKSKSIIKKSQIESDDSTKKKKKSFFKIRSESGQSGSESKPEDYTEIAAKNSKKVPCHSESTEDSSKFVKKATQRKNEMMKEEKDSSPRNVTRVEGDRSELMALPVSLTTGRPKMVKKKPLIHDSSEKLTTDDLFSPGSSLPLHEETLEEITKINQIKDGESAKFKPTGGMPMFGGVGGSNALLAELSKRKNKRQDSSDKVLNDDHHDISSSKTSSECLQKQEADTEDFKPPSLSLNESDSKNSSKEIKTKPSPPIACSPIKIQNMKSSETENNVSSIPKHSPMSIEVESIKLELKTRNDDELKEIKITESLQEEDHLEMNKLSLKINKDDIKSGNNDTRNEISKQSDLNTNKLIKDETETLNVSKEILKMDPQISKSSTSEGTINVENASNITIEKEAMMNRENNENTIGKKSKSENENCKELEETLETSIASLIINKNNETDQESDPEINNNEINLRLEEQIHNNHIHQGVESSNEPKRRELIPRKNIHDNKNQDEQLFINETLTLEISKKEHDDKKSELACDSQNRTQVGSPNSSMNLANPSNEQPNKNEEQISSVKAMSQMFDRIANDKEKK